jgi:hypothetical protein
LAQTGEQDTMDEQGPQEEAYNQEAWELLMEAERHELQMRREGHLAKILGPAATDESPEELKRLVDEDRKRAEEGLVELMDESSGQITYKHIEELSPKDRLARTRAEGARIEWIAERQRRRQPPPRPGPRDPADR